MLIIMGIIMYINIYYLLLCINEFMQDDTKKISNGNTYLGCVRILNIL